MGELLILLVLGALLALFVLPSLLRRATTAKRDQRVQHTRAEIASALAEYATRRDEWVIIDCETTGLAPTDVVIEVAVISGRGEQLLNTRVKLPARKRISAKAAAIHGITREHLAGAPEWASVRAEIAAVVGARECLAYNAPFETRLFEQTDRAHAVEAAPLRWVDVMPLYNLWCAEWDERRGKTKWQKLPGGDHSAIGDCHAVYAMLTKIGMP